MPLSQTFAHCMASAGGEGEGDGSQEERKQVIIVALQTAAATRQRTSSTKRRGRPSAAAASVDETAVLTLDDLEEAAAYLLETVEERGIKLPSTQSTDGSSHDGPHPDYELSALQGHPLYDVASTTLIEVLSFDEHEAQQAAPDVVESILTGLTGVGNDEADQGNDGQPRHLRGFLGDCGLCERSMPLTAHHLIPKSEHARMLRIDPPPFTQKEMYTRIAWLCRPCHSAVHSLISSRELADEWNTLEKLEEVESVRKWARYASGLKERQKGYEGFGLKNKR